MGIIIATKLLLAHILGDFVLQPSAWVRDKQQKTYRSKWLYGKPDTGH